MPSGPNCEVRIVRHSQYADGLRKYKIFVNGMHVGSIARESVLDIQVPRGPVTMEARIDWARSRPLVVEAVPDRRTEIEVSNHWGPLLCIWAAIFGFRAYLTLQHKPTA